MPRPVVVGEDVVGQGQHEMVHREMDRHSGDQRGTLVEMKSTMKRMRASSVEPKSVGEYRERNSLDGSETERTMYSLTGDAVVETGNQSLIAMSVPLRDRSTHILLVRDDLRKHP